MTLGLKPVIIWTLINPNLKAGVSYRNRKWALAQNDKPYIDRNIVKK